MARAKVPSVFERRQAEKRPLDALAADVAEASFRRVDRALAIPIARLVPSPDNPRTETLDENLQEFAASIAERGILQPLAVRRDPEKAGYYYVIAGSRRLLAAQIVRMSERPEERARVEELPCVVREGTPEDIFADALVENLARQDLSRAETMHALRRLQDDYGWAVRDIARRTGRSPGDISELLNVARDVDLAPFVAAETISPSAAVQIRRLPDELRPAAIEGVRAGTVRKVKDVQRLRAQARPSVAKGADDGARPDEGEGGVFVNEQGVADRGGQSPHAGGVFVNEQPDATARGSTTAKGFVNEYARTGEGLPTDAAGRIVTVGEHTRRIPPGRRVPRAYRPDDATVERLARDVLTFLGQDPLLSPGQVETLRAVSAELAAYLADC